MDDEFAAVPHESEPAAGVAAAAAAAPSTAAGVFAPTINPLHTRYHIDVESVAPDRRRDRNFRLVPRLSKKRREVATEVVPGVETVFSMATPAESEASVLLPAPQRSRKDAMHVSDDDESGKDEGDDDDSELGAVGRMRPRMHSRRKSAIVPQNIDYNYVDSAAGQRAMSPLLLLLFNGHPFVSREQLINIKSVIHLYRGERALRPWTAAEKNMIIEGLSHPAMLDPIVNEYKYEFIQVLGWNAVFWKNCRSCDDISDCVDFMISKGEMPEDIVEWLANPANASPMAFLSNKSNKKKLRMMAIYHSRTLDKRAKALLEMYYTGAIQWVTDEPEQDEDDDLQALAGIGIKDAGTLDATALKEEAAKPPKRFCSVMFVRDAEHMSRIAVPGSSHTAKFIAASTRLLRDFIIHAMKYSFPKHMVTDGCITFTDSLGDDVTFTLSRVSTRDGRRLADVHLPSICTVTVKATVINGVGTDRKRRFEALLLREDDVKASEALTEAPTA